MRFLERIILGNEINLNKIRESGRYSTNKFVNENHETLLIYSKDEQLDYFQIHLFQEKGMKI
jgi:hypothetical protein